MRGGETTCGEGRIGRHYRKADTLFAVPVATRPVLSVGTPRVLIEGIGLPEPVADVPLYDRAPDGRFLTIQRDEPRRPTLLRVVLAR